MPRLGPKSAVAFCVTRRPGRVINPSQSTTAFVSILDRQARFPAPPAVEKPNVRNSPATFELGYPAWVGVCFGKNLWQMGTIQPAARPRQDIGRSSPCLLTTIGALTTA
jgi:hypothetical protein